LEHWNRQARSLDRPSAARTSTLVWRQGAALGFFLIQNHPFVDGNKRVGHAAMVSFLGLDGRRLEATVDEAAQAFLHVASGILDRAGLQAWIEAHEVPRS
jgi:death-on-curing protein